MKYAEPVRLDPDILAVLEQFIPLAPLHQPHKPVPDPPSDGAPGRVWRRSPCLRYGVFIPTNSRRLSALRHFPRSCTNAGVKRYGLSRALIRVRRLGAAWARRPRAATGRTVRVPSSATARACGALERGPQRRQHEWASRPWTGCPWARGAGPIDPGVPALPHGPARHGRARAIEKAHLQRVGPARRVRNLERHAQAPWLGGAPGEASRGPLRLPDPARELGSLAAARSAGLDALVFHGRHRGKNSPVLRERICRDGGMAGAGVRPRGEREGRVRASARAGQPGHRGGSFPTSEELMIAQHTQRLRARPWRPGRRRIAATKRAKEKEASMSANVKPASEKMGPCMERISRPGHGGTMSDVP